MLEVALMIEGQNGLNWPRWQKIVRLAEDLGFAGLYRSDHFTNANPPDLDSLEMWTSFTWLAGNTRRIQFGPLVSPFSFRHPAFTARIAAAVDDLSGGRLTLGLGAGWQAREHNNFGFELLDVPGRFARFAEGLEVVRLLLTSDTPVAFAGKYYNLKDAIMLPRPVRPGGPPILIGGNGVKLTLPLVARYAAEWNAVYIPPDAFASANARLDDLLRAAGRAPETVKRSLMTGCHFSADEAGVRRKLGGRLREDLLRNGIVVGTADEVVDQLRAYAAAGVQRIMLQWMELDDLEGIEALARQVLPRLN